MVRTWLTRRRRSRLGLISEYSQAADSLADIRDKVKGCRWCLVLNNMDLAPHPPLPPWYPERKHVWEEIAGGMRGESHPDRSLRHIGYEKPLCKKLGQSVPS